MWQRLDELVLHKVGYIISSSYARPICTSTVAEALLVRAPESIPPRAVRITVGVL